MPNEKEKYFKNYKLENIPDDSRKGYKRIYKYIGNYYSFDISATDIKKTKFLFLFLEIVSTLVFIFTALQKKQTLYYTCSHHHMSMDIRICCSWIFLFC